MEPTSRSAGRLLNLRGLITLLTALAYSVMAISGVMLYLAPRGRVANWTGRSLLGLGKEPWSDLHMTMGGAAADRDRLSPLRQLQAVTALSSPFTKVIFARPSGRTGEDYRLIRAGV
jgi:hypothetical protein